MQSEIMISDSKGSFEDSKQEYPEAQNPIRVVAALFIAKVYQMR
jgi:hypothetical protein